jgi:AraC-like DNA-binding protein
MAHAVTCCDPLHAGKSVSAVAARWGFLDAAHFSRTFRDAFGMSPTDWRRNA